MKKLKDEDLRKIKRKLNKYIKTILFITMLVLIYILSPRITNAIQAFAKFIYELDSSNITRVVELVLAISFSLAVVINKDNKKEV